jgi:chromosome segregation ATPase
MKSQLDEGKAELHKLESKVENAQASVRDKYRQTIEELGEKLVAAETKLEEIELAGEEALKDLKDEAEKIWSAFKAGVDVFRDFSNHS